MGLPSIENFDISFICRTLKNFEGYKGEYKFTMLLNSLLGLIVVPNEQKGKKGFTPKFMKSKLIDFADLQPIFSKTSENLLKEEVEITQRKFFWVSKSNKSRPIDEIIVEEFLTRMRHSIAHFGITPIAKSEDKHQWCGVILQNFCPKCGCLNFEVCLMEDEIEILARFISREYCNAVVLTEK